MSVAKAVRAENSRLNEVFDNLLTTLRNFVKENRITHDEYRRAVAFMTEVGQKCEVSLLCDVFIEVSVDAVDNSGRSGTITTIEGPFYVHDAPILKSPCVLPQRLDESGPVLLFTGTVLSSKGEPLPGAVLDLWQSDTHGLYSHFDIPKNEAPYNLRARVTTDRQGRFDVQTRLPAPYEIPKSGPTGALLAALERHAWRPAHLHMKVEHSGHRTLTTQLFLKKDPWIDSDVVEGAVKQALIVDPVMHDDADDLHRRNFSEPYFTLSYDFLLEPAISKAASEVVRYEKKQ